MNVILGLDSVINKNLLSILSITLVSMILIISQSPVAFAGYCIDDDNDGYYAQDCGGEIDCNDENPDIYPGHGCNPVEDVQTIINDVEELIEDGDLAINNGQTNAILTKLQEAIDKIDSENTNAAIGSLNAFINQINAFINSGSISVEEGQTLIDGAQSIINYL